MNNGRVTIRAQDTLIRGILAEWGRVGNTAIIDANELTDETVTLELVDVMEAQALHTLLRGASGYMAAPRAAMNDGASRFDRILILATSKPAALVATVASPGRAPVSAPRAGGASGPRLGVVPNSQRGRTPFAVSAEQQEQLDQLQQLLQQSDDDEPPKPAAVQPVFGDVPAARPGLPMGTVDPQQATVGIPTGAFGSTTSVPETTGTRAITTRQP